LGAVLHFYKDPDFQWNVEGYVVSYTPWEKMFGYGQDLLCPNPKNLKQGTVSSILGAQTSVLVVPVMIMLLKQKLSLEERQKRREKWLG